MHSPSEASGESVGSTGEVGEGVPRLESQAKGGGAAREKRHPLSDDVKRFLDLTREHYHVPGISVGVIDGDETYFSASDPSNTSREGAV